MSLITYSKEKVLGALFALLFGSVAIFSLMGQFRGSGVQTVESAPAGTLTVTVFQDTNGNGSVDASEPARINGVTVSLFDENDGGTAACATDTTDLNGEKLFEKVLKKSAEWGDQTKLMYVVGATRAEKIADVRKIAPKHFFLVPGVGAQGGSLDDVANYGWNDDCGLLVNSSRGILYAGNGEDFADKSRAVALDIQQQMKSILENKKFV